MGDKYEERLGTELIGAAACCPSFAPGVLRRYGIPQL